MKCSVIVLTFNSEAYIEDTIRAALQVSDDVHAVDSFSTDQTVAILQRLGVKITTHPFEHYGKQRNWAITNCECLYEWQLHLDSDEVMSPELVEEIRSLPDNPEVDGFFLPRMPAFLGRKIYYGAMYPIWHMRLFRKVCGHCEDRKYDQHFYVEGQTGKLKNPMVDYVCATLSEWVVRHNKWADAEVAELAANERVGRIQGNAEGNPIEKQRYWRTVYERFPLFVRPFLLFFYRYFLKLGFLDGIEGLIFFFLKDFWFRFLIDAKIYEQRLKTRRNSKS
ncbi:MAG: glycosyltransferase family 2 protein [Candidatus Riflebacteria bacterium]|nr:glycosyltransferase family 2 protein [Candidatus Riflebacteria bacterium]